MLSLKSSGMYPDLYILLISLVIICIPFSPVMLIIYFSDLNSYLVFFTQIIFLIVMSTLISLAQRMIFIVIHLILLLVQKFRIICIPGCGIPCRLTLSLSLVSLFLKKYLRPTCLQIPYSST